MKKFFIFLAISFWACCSIAQTTSYYKVFQGKVDGMDATLHLHVAGNKATGFLWFNKIPQPMQCYGKFTRDSLTISANDNLVSISMNGKLAGADFTGASVFEKENNDPADQAASAKKGNFDLHYANNSGFTDLSYVYAEGTAKMPANIKNESTAAFHAATVWPKPMTNKTFENALKSYVNLEFNNKGAIKEPGKIFLAQKSAYLNEWKASMAKMDPKEANEMGSSLSQETEESINIVYEDEKLICLSHFSYEYTGGAHGNYATSFSNFNKKTGVVIKLTDVLTKEGIARLPGLLEAAIRQQYGLDKNKTLEENGLFVKRIEPSENFYLAKKALGFSYSPYELMAYSFGEPTIFISAASIEKYLKPAYKN